MANTPTLRLSSPNRHPASAIMMLANNGKSGIRI